MSQANGDVSAPPAECGPAGRCGVGSPPGLVPIAVLLAMLAVTAAVTLHSAWLCDDAYITFRVVDNFVSGHGLRWNIADRVMVYTHPLWCIALIGVRTICGSLPEPTIWFSLVLGLAAVALILPWRGQAAWSCAAVALLLPGSKVFAEYATSGLETPLAFLLVALLLRAVRRPVAVGGFSVALLLALTALTRHDLVLLVAPLGIVWYLNDDRRLPTLGMAAGTLPLVLWEAFALFYYGSLLPNTGPAKLGGGVPLGDRLSQGLWYGLDFVARDPVGAFGLAASIVFLLVAGNRLGRSLGLGSLLYLGYTVWIGGGFMSGRFFAVPLFVSIAGAVGILCGELGAGPLRLRRLVVVGAATAAVLGLVGAIPQPSSVIDSRGVGDERRFWQDALSLSAVSDGQNVLRIGWVKAAVAARQRGEPEVVVRGSIGLFGYYCGPRVHVVDRYALADPLLSRLPALGNCRAGHFERHLPEGYLDSLQADRNLITDPDLRDYYDTIRTIFRAPLLSSGRMPTILRFQMGGLDQPLGRYLERRGRWHREPTQRQPAPPDLTIRAFYSR